MNLGLWLQYIIVGVLVVASIGYAFRKIRTSARTGDCAGGCSQCNSCAGADAVPPQTQTISLQRTPRQR